MAIEKLGGAVIFCRGEKGVELALVHDMFGYWTLSKGHLEANEEDKSGVAREIKEEVSLEVEVMDHLGNNEYISSDPEKGKIRKQVAYYLAECKDPEALKLTKSGGLDEAKWFPLAKIADLRMYDDVVPFVTKAIKLLSTHAGVAK
jgi:ADP-ribose pyrophosphatase YjhB (NUDIX family)